MLWSSPSQSIGICCYSWNKKFGGGGTLSSNIFLVVKNLSHKHRCDFQIPDDAT